MEKRIIKRILSLAVALEMLLSPLTTARAYDPSERPETPRGEEAVQVTPRPASGHGRPTAEDAAAPALPDTPDPSVSTEGDSGEEAPSADAVDAAAADIDTPAVSTPDEGAVGDTALEEAVLLDDPATFYAFNMSFGMPLNNFGHPTYYNGYFTYEGGTRDSWGYRVLSPSKYTYSKAQKIAAEADGNFYTTLPKAGRMPDRTLEGFYIPSERPVSWYTTDAGYIQEDVDKIRSWTFDETWADPVRIAEVTDKTAAEVGLIAAMDVDVNNYDAVAMLTGAQMTALKSANLLGTFSEPNPPYTNYVLIPLVARWVPSANNRITTLMINTFDKDGKKTAATEVRKESGGDLKLETIGADTFADANSEREFWLQVGEDQETLTLQFAAYEPYYDYNVKNNGAGTCPVSVSVDFNGEVVKDVNDENIVVTRGWDVVDGAPTDAIYPMPSVNPSGRYTPRNNATSAPARSRWTVAGIPLAKVGELNKPYTTISLTITAPNGAKDTYTIHVERLMTPVSELGYGNTPVGMILRDAGGQWGRTEAERTNNKQAAIESFRVERNLTQSTIKPSNYTFYKSDYKTAPWLGLVWEGKTTTTTGSNEYYNIDLDPTAVIAYQDMAFADPGVSFTGSNGKTVLFGKDAEGAYQTCVTRTIELKTADALTASLYDDPNAGETCWYNVDDNGDPILTKDATKASQTLHKADGSDVVDLRGLKVLPGVYTITYTYEDPNPLSNVVLEAKRPLVVLPIPGDVDMDGAVTVTDALTLQAYQSTWNNAGVTHTAATRLLLNRVVGGTTKSADGEDETVNARVILEGFQPILAGTGGRTDYFYPPLSAPDNVTERNRRRTWSEVKGLGDNGEATLELRYLGLETGILQAEQGNTLNPGGPWQANADGLVTIRDAGSDSYRTYQSDVFWMGVYLTGNLSGSEVEDLTLSLIYDSEYVRPAVVYAANNGIITAGSSQEARWLNALYYYNMEAGSKFNGAGKTLFSGLNGGDYAYDKLTTGSTLGRSYATHYSKVIGDLETAQSNSANLKEMVVSFQGVRGSTRRATLPNGTDQSCCLLVVPFQLIKHPAAGRLEEVSVGGEDQVMARLIELGAGMRDFNLVTKAGIGSRVGTNAGSLFSAMLSALNEPQTLALSAGDVTYAYSAQDTIYGDATQNLRNQVSYQTTAGKIPIGQNKTSNVVLAEGTYAEEYKQTVVSGTIDSVKNLPKGLTYSNVVGGVISGTPEETGTFKFVITVEGQEYYYTLKINKRKLHFRPEIQGSYYGEVEFRGEPGERVTEDQRDFTFRYNVSDLAERDKPAGSLAGLGSELPAILGSDYEAPTFTARLSTDTGAEAITRRTPKGLYPILPDLNGDGEYGKDDKYELVYESEKTIYLEIYRRWVWVDHLEVDFDALRKDENMVTQYPSLKSMAQIHSDGSSLTQSMSAIDDTYDENTPDGTRIFLSVDKERFGTDDGTYGGRPLSGSAVVPGDVIRLTFNGTFQRNELDKEKYPKNADMFYLTKGSEPREIGKYTIEITDTQRGYFETDNPNYRLVSSNEPIISPEKNNVAGTVIRREITSMEITSYPVALQKNGSTTYGEGITLTDLRIRIFRDSQQIGDRPYDDPDYAYNGVTATAMNVHYNWVTKEEMELGSRPEYENTILGTGWDPSKPADQQDAKPYHNTNNFLDMSMNGMYLCAVVRKYEVGDTDEGEIEKAVYNGRQYDKLYIKCYSENPITIQRRILDLTLVRMSRFYGEASATPRYKYDTSQLTNADNSKIRQHFNISSTAKLAGTDEELEWLLESDENYVKPQFYALRNVPEDLTSQPDLSPTNLVTPTTPVTGTTFYQIICGAESTNYTFRYKRGETENDYSTVCGTAYLSVEKRPIVVEDVYSMYAQNPDGKDNFATIYADTRTMLLTTQVDRQERGEKDKGIPFTASAAEGKVVFSAPTMDADNNLIYYVGGVSNQAPPLAMDYTGDPVLAEDLAGLSVKYNVQFIPDPGHYTWSSLSQNYYSLEDLEAAGGQDQRDVEIRGLELQGEKAINYQLVYKQSYHAVQKAPNSAQRVTAPNPTTEIGKTGDTAFLRYGTGLVILRPIKDLTITSLGRMRYTYGMTFAPGESDAGLNSSRLTLRVNYDTRYDNDPEENVNSEEVTYEYESSETGDSDSFTRRGFAIHYIDAPSGTATVAERMAIAEAADPAERNTLLSGDPLYPLIHNGKRLFVSGRRGETDELALSEVSSRALEVAPAEITLTARDLHRYYGEANSNGYTEPIARVEDADESGALNSYTFPASALADWDLAAINELLGTGIRTTDIVTRAELEQALALAESGTPAQQAWAAGFGYNPPNISVNAAKDAEINMGHGRWGEYPVNIASKNFSSYRVTGKPGTLYVYPRPIQITDVRSSADDPVITVFNKTDGSRFNTSFKGDRVSVAASNKATGTVGWNQTLATGGMAHLHLTSTVGVLPGDALVYRGTVQFLESIVLPDDVTDATMDVVVTISQDTGLGSSSGDVQKNYTLTSKFEDPHAVGAVKLRTIGEIFIESLPKAKYTYGQPLDLSGLRVLVVYMRMGDEAMVAETVRVDFIDPEQFQTYGLYVNYWDYDNDRIPANLKAIPTAYRKAATGDHVTIAPTHDTQQFEGNDMSKPLERLFRTNGAGLIISAYQEGGNQAPAQSKIVAADFVKIDGYNSYEITEGNTTPFRFSVQPMRLNYSVTATNKTYNGDKKTAGTLSLTNVFDRRNVQTQYRYNEAENTQKPEYETVTDVVFIPVGASYEGVNQPGRYSSYTAAAGYQVQSGAISFTTGSYDTARTLAPNRLLDTNTAVEWAEGYVWDKAPEPLMQFTFPNANVHYVDEAFASGRPGVGTEELAEYWKTSQDFNTTDGRWDSYPEVSQMPVEVRYINLRGPDAENYTWGPSDEPQTHSIELTLDSDPAQIGPGQAGLPYATIYKANRQPIQDLLREKGFVLPTLQLDKHTNVVRLHYGEDLDKIEDRTDPDSKSVYERPDGAVLNETGTDSFRDELHFEYALLYQDANGLLTQWAGRAGDRGYQDTLFFGGESVAPAVDPDYVPELDDLEKPEDLSEDTIFKGQRYQWADVDTGVSERGYVEDSGFYIDVSAYPGYTTYGEAIRDAYWFCDLYHTDRAGLPRDTVCYPLVRLAETHNYNPSGDLTGDADGDGRPDISAREIYDARVAVNAYLAGAHSAQGEELKAAAQEKSQDVFAAAAGMDRAAKALAQSQVDHDADLAESGDWPEVPPEEPSPTSAVKTYLQRFDVISARWDTGVGSGEEYLAKILESVWFSDTLAYPEQTNMDAVLYNNPTRYYAYAWDPDMSAFIAFGDEEHPVDFGTIMQAEVQEQQPGGDVVEKIWTYDPEATNHTAQLYVRLTRSGGQLVRKIRIVPSTVFAWVGDSPIQLGTITDPKNPRNDRYSWRSSNPAVATVDQYGLLSIHGPGMATITVSTSNGKYNSITVIVSAMTPLGPTTNPLFNFHYTGPWAALDTNYAFRPKDCMTRGEVVRLLDLFINPNLAVTADREIAYVDVTGKERYYGALVRLSRVGVVQGVPGSAFAGERLATRAEFITMIARMLELDVFDTAGLAHAFVDAGEDRTWAYAYIDAAAKAGIIQGTGGGYFAPGRNITREEVAAIIARLVVAQVSKDEKDLTIPVDVTPENWSYAAVLRAVNTVMAPGY